jgi:hypothetical protein
MAMHPFSAYEQHVVREIAAWNSAPSLVLDRLLQRFSRPIRRGLSRLASSTAVIAAFDSACSISHRYVNSPHPDPLFVESMARGGSSLEVSDQLALRVRQTAQVAAFLGGAVTGAVGFLFAPIDIAALTLMSVTTIYRMARCYGFSLERDEDRPYVLTILVLAGTSDLRERGQLVAQLQEMHHWVFIRTAQLFALEGVTRQLIQLATLESVPGIGMIVGAAANLSFMRRVLTDCQRIFQQRWLRQHCHTEMQANDLDRQYASGQTR